MPHIYVAGDCKSGPATVVRGISDAARVSAAIAGISFDDPNLEPETSAEEYKERHSVLCSEIEGCDGKRCLGCPKICTEVCPNRANVSVKVDYLDEPQIIHIDPMCNECGNCAVFCPYDSRPYKDKFTLFANEADFEDSTNEGFTVLSDGKVKVRYDNEVFVFSLDKPDPKVLGGVVMLIEAIIKDYSYLLEW